MSGQERCSQFDASSRTRILTPSSESVLSNHEALVVESKKRKRERGAMEDLLDDSFAVKPHPSTIFSKLHILYPVALISRMDVPLSCLDTLSPSGPLPASRFFQAHVKILELEVRMGNIPMVLVARLDDGKSLFVVERVEHNLYVLCKLGSWVNLSQLCATAIVSRNKPDKLVASGHEMHTCFQGNDGEKQVIPGFNKYSKRKRLAIEAIQSIVKRPSREPLITTQGVSSICSQSAAAVEPHSQEQIKVETPQEHVIVRPMANEIFDNLRSQYFEALYLSRASLAYFAKGPLSRARAAFHLDYDSTLDMNDLIGFVESLILPANVVDRKYKEGVPNLLSRLIMLDESADEPKNTLSKSKKLGNKKMKPGKNGLYPEEDTYICRWWSSHDADADVDGLESSKENGLKKKVAQLRIRETQLQMIVILEALALRPLATSPTDHNGELPSMGQIDGMLDGETVSSKSKKPLDLAVLLEVHVDRLCIWQSLTAGEGRIASTIVEASNDGPRSQGLTNRHDHAADLLREFCTEVVVPFFSARLPEHCGTISRKLGGPVVASPERPKLIASARSTAAPLRPGAVVKRHSVTKARSSLRRVLTDERHARDGCRGSSGAISLMRSATAPVIPGLKREWSETSLLSSIPPAEAHTILVSRGGVLKSRKFSQREIDLNSLANIGDSKMKKASIEAELKDAISALKRPNRQLAGQQQVEMAERRVASAPMHSRKSKKPTRNPSFQGVQILSTPKGNRQKDAALDNHHISGLESRTDHELEVIYASSIAKVPLSMARAANTRETEKTSLCKETPTRPRARASAISMSCRTPGQSCAISPSRPSSRVLRASPHSHNGAPIFSPLQAKCSSKQQLLDVPVPFVSTVECTPKIITVPATPAKQGKSNTLIANTPTNSPK